MPKLINVFNKTTNESMFQRNVIWTMGNLCRSKPLPKYNLIKDATKVFYKVILNCKSEDLLIDALWPLTYMTE